MFKKITVISLIALPIMAFAQTGIVASTTPKIVDWAVKGQCIANAIDARETTIISNQTAMNTSVITALNTRKEALKTAWLKSERKDRVTAREAAWKAFKDAHKSARNTLETANKTAWNTFKTAEKACGVQTGENPAVMTSTSSI